MLPINDTAFTEIYIIYTVHTFWKTEHEQHVIQSQHMLTNVLN
jgi:hypothetical protein